jgi:hypothetical protein
MINFVFVGEREKERVPKTVSTLISRPIAFTILLRL